MGGSLRPPALWRRVPPTRRSAARTATRPSRGRVRVSVIVTVPDPTQAARSSWSAARASDKLRLKIPLEGPVAALVVIVSLLLVALFVTFSAIKTVPQGFEYTVQRFGRYTRTLKPGIAILTPFVETVGRRISMMEQVLPVPQQEVITKDNVGVQVDAIVFIQVMDASAAAYRVANLSGAITQLVMTNLRTVVGSMDLDEVLSNRDHINTRLLGVIDEATSPWGVKVARIEIKDLQPPPDITNAMTRQMKAERERRAVITEAEGEKQAAITRAEGSKQSAILQAEGRKEAAFRDAEARERLAGAEAQATKVVSDAIEGGSVSALNYFVAQKYVEAFGKLAESNQQRTVIVPADFSGISGSIAGILELVRGAGGPNAAPPRAPPPPPRPSVPAGS
jgi:regulator of protease activity HflC (stomatin/prohibitin superfamily)